MSPDAIRPQRVLVVDDTPETLALLTDALEEAGMTVLVSIDGASAIDRVQHAAPDIILLDAVMPGMDGFETCTRLKQLPHAAGVPVVFMTGLSDTEHVLRGFQAGGVDYVTKPIVPEQLIARLRTHLSNARLVSSARDALDLAGRAAFSIGEGGTLVWQTPEAARLLQPILEGSGGVRALPSALHRRLLGQAADGDEARTRRRVDMQDVAGGLVFTTIGRAAGGELLVAVEASAEADNEARLRARFGLTTRECEVLLWVARGKSNRDVGEILELSPRTVNKHLERIFVKLGVENRAGAAAMAIGVLSERP
jgi:DNA-binding NarL/FixJ family response regulator